MAHILNIFPSEVHYFQWNSALRLNWICILSSCFSSDCIWSLHVLDWHLTTLDSVWRDNSLCWMIYRSELRRALGPMKQEYKSSAEPSIKSRQFTWLKCISRLCWLSQEMLKTNGQFSFFHKDMSKKWDDRTLGKKLMGIYVCVYIFVWRAGAKWELVEQLAN